MTRDEVDKLLTAVDIDSDEGIRDKAILELMYGTGMRASELVNLKLSDLNPNERVVRITGKGGKTRIVPLHKDGWFWIEKYLSESRGLILKNERGTNNLFIKQKAKKLTRQDLWKLTNKYAEWAGLKKRVYPVAVFVLNNFFQLCNKFYNQKRGYCIMKVLILAGGYGTRLGKLGEMLPKPLLSRPTFSTRHTRLKRSSSIPATVMM